MKNYIIQNAKKLNIDMIAFTDSEPLYNLEEYLKRRKEKGYTTDFEEDDLQKRIDPKRTMENCNSIIVLALSYNVDFKPISKFKFKGSLSRSSWGEDYHRVLKRKIEELIAEIKKIQDFEYKYYVDTGPLVDRELAHKAGIGYYGKNCSIINDEYGSFIFIGYIMTDLNISPDKGYIESKCGDCELCLKACPTNALENPYILNPKRCISYLTQTKDEIALDLKNKMGIKIYGCDTCQLVCPKNKGVKRSIHKEFIPDKTSGAIDIEELLKMSNREFKNKYGHMAGSWRGRNTLRRNALIALDNILNKDNKDDIEELLKQNI